MKKREEILTSEEFKKECDKYGLYNVDAEAFNNVKEVLGDVMHQLLIVSKVVFTSEELPKYDNVSVKIERSTGEKCNRCWNYVDHLNGDICDRCHNIINS